VSDEPSQDEKTEEPSAKRLHEAREKGDVAKSMELSAGIMMVGGTGALWVIIELSGPTLARQLRAVWMRLDEGERMLTNPGALLDAVFMPALMALVPTFGVLCVTAIAAHLAQTGPMWSFKAMEPKLSKFNVLKGVKRLFFSKDAAVNLLKTLAKVALVGAVAGLTVWYESSELTSLTHQSAGAFASYLQKVVIVPLFVASLITIVLGVGDFAWQKKRKHDQLKMTKEEAKREHKEQEGDPLMKGRRQAKHRELMSVNRLIDTVPEADVVVNNPTHISVALRYRESDGAPVVVAKGADHRAMKIREIAKESKVPMVTNVPLARALYAAVDEEDYIPEEFYRAVAEVLAVTWRGKSKRRRR
jgi:flagellar biosynthetic protein FlhB